jgi:hypothetical protein
VVSRATFGSPNARRPLTAKSEGAGEPFMATSGNGAGQENLGPGQQVVIGGCGSAACFLACPGPARGPPPRATLTRRWNLGVADATASKSYPLEAARRFGPADAEIDVEEQSFGGVRAWLASLEAQPRTPPPASLAADENLAVR